MHRSTRNFLRWTAIGAALLMLTGAEAGTAIADAGTRHIAAPAAPAAPAASAIIVRTVKGGLKDPAAFTFSPTPMGGPCCRYLIYFLERGTGRLKSYNVRTKKLKLIYKISGVDANGERGALGLALSPTFPAIPYVYVYVTRRSSPSAPVQNQLVRIRITGGEGVSLRVLFKQPVSSATNHNGGRILFGPDGKLYVVIGENADPANSQNLANLRGKILRVNANSTKADGSAVAGNFHHRIWAYGIRNSFGFTFDPMGGRLWETDNGPNCNDEINLIRVGRNYGWGPSEACGSQTAPGDTNNSGPTPRILPKTFFVSTLGITGAAFCDSCALGAGSEGRLFFGCVNDGVIRSVGLNGARNDTAGGVASVLTAPSGLVYSMETSPNGTIYFSNPNGIFRLSS